MPIERRNTNIVLFILPSSLRFRSRSIIIPYERPQRLKKPIATILIRPLQTPRPHNPSHIPHIPRRRPILPILNQILHQLQPRPQIRIRHHLQRILRPRRPHRPTTPQLIHQRRHPKRLHPLTQYLPKRYPHLRAHSRVPTILQQHNPLLHRTILRQNRRNDHLPKHIPHVQINSIRVVGVVVCMCMYRRTHSLRSRSRSRSRRVW